MSAMLLAPSDMLGLAVGLGSVIIVLLVWQGLVARDRLQRLRLLAEQGLAGQRSEAETLRATLAATEAGGARPSCAPCWTISCRPAPMRPTGSPARDRTTSWNSR